MEDVRLTEESFLKSSLEILNVIDISKLEIQFDMCGVGKTAGPVASVHTLSTVFTVLAARAIFASSSFGYHFARNLFVNITPLSIYDLYRSNYVEFKSLTITRLNNNGFLTSTSVNYSVGDSEYTYNIWV